MIKEYSCYDIICDRCGQSLTKLSGDCYPDTKSAEFVAEESEWHKIGNKHYCPWCVVMDENTGEYIPREGGEK